MIHQRRVISMFSTVTLGMETVGAGSGGPIPWGSRCHSVSKDLRPPAHLKRPAIHLYYVDQWGAASVFPAAGVVGRNDQVIPFFTYDRLHTVQKRNEEIIMQIVTASQSPGSFGLPVWLQRVVHTSSGLEHSVADPQLPLKWRILVDITAYSCHGNPLLAGHIMDGNGKRTRVI